jgi:hypothetical protein
VALSGRRLVGGFPLVHAAGGQLPERRADRIPELPDQDDLPRFRHGNEHDRLRVAHDIDGDLAAVRHLDTVAVHVEHLAVEHAFAADTLLNET